jgi:hypothetical protein
MDLIYIWQYIFTNIKFKNSQIVYLYYDFVSVFISCHVQAFNFICPYFRANLLVGL